MLPVWLICPPRSLSARRAWIEIDAKAAETEWTAVALRKESVDRNYTIVMVGLLMCVALRKESVDRNDVLAISAVLELMSLSARRAWIEM